MNGRRWVRRCAAALTLVLAVEDLVRAARPHGRSAGDLVRLGQAVSGAGDAVLVAGLVLVLAVGGLLHGRRNSARLAILGVVLGVIGRQRSGPGHVWTVVATGLVLLLVLGRSSFRSANDPTSVRRGLTIGVTGLAVVLVYGSTGLWFLDRHVRGDTTVTGSLLGTIRLMALLPSPVEPVTHHGHWFLGSVRVASIAVVLVAAEQIVASVASGARRRADDEATVRRLLAGHAETGLAPFQLLDDKSWFVHGEAFVGYKVVAGVAVALGEPIGALDDREPCARAFVQQCRANGWIPAFHQTTGPGMEVLRRTGLRSLKIGEEAVVVADDFDLADHRHKSLRSALRRVERAGFVVREHRAPLEEHLVAELHAISDEWLAHGGHRERTFTLGRFDPVQIRLTDVITLEHTDGRIAAFVTVLPSYRSVDVNFDLMRRRSDAPNGAMEALFVALVEQARSTGRHGVLLGLAPLSGIEGTTAADRALRLIYERGGAAFNFEGLRAFKAKWGPEWQPRYLCYPSDTDLPRVAAAVVRAGELPALGGWADRLRRIGRRLPFSVAVGAVVAWLMIASSLDGRIHPVLVRHLGLRWRDLERLQLWRLLTSPLIQTDPGWRPHLLLLATIVPIAEWRFGTRRTALAAITGDTVSTLLVLLGARVGAAFGSGTAVHVLTTRDGGLSSAVFALAAFTVVTSGRGRLAFVVGSIASVELAGGLIFGHGLADVQHMVAAAVGAVVASLPARRAEAEPGFSELQRTANDEPAPLP